MNSFILTSLIAQEKFRAFSLPHIIFILTTLSIIVILAYYRENIRYTKAEVYLRYIIAALLFASEVSKQIGDLQNGAWSIKGSLPLHLCGITSVICIVMLITKSYKLFEVMYFWSLIGSPLAMILPDLNVSYASIIFWGFMISHSMNIIAVVYMMTTHDYRPTTGSIMKGFLYTNIYMVFIAGFNYIAGSNYYYFYLCKDPSPRFVNPFKTVTSWTAIIFLLEILTIVMLVISYLPYYLKDYNRKKEGYISSCESFQGENDITS